MPKWLYILAYYRTPCPKLFNMVLVAICSFQANPISNIPFYYFYKNILIFVNQNTGQTQIFT